MAAPAPLPPILSIPELLCTEAPPVEWIIEGFLSRGALVAVAGVPGAGKSFLFYTISVALATGTPTLGWTMAPQRVLYFDQENSLPDCTQYLRWAYNGLGSPDLLALEENFHIAHFVLGGPSWAVVARRYVEAYRPALIVIDTTTPACHVQDENDNAEASRVIGSLRSIQKSITPAPAIIALKHAKVDHDNGIYTIRGAKTWEGAVDSVVYQIRDRGRPKSDGLSPTRLEPSKSRAFGLREPVPINPKWVLDRAGLQLSRG